MKKYVMADIHGNYQKYQQMLRRIEVALPWLMEEVTEESVIDCGSGYDGRLGCLCLDTMEAFYV